MQLGCTKSWIRCCATVVAVADATDALQTIATAATVVAGPNGRVYANLIICCGGLIR